jgi:hypothetical protein
MSLPSLRRPAAALCAGVGLALTCAVLATASCSSTGSTTSTTTPPDSNVPLLSDSGPCGVTTQRYAITSANHVPIGTTVPYVSNPPCGGDHYGIWVTWGAHAVAIPVSFWVHNLEHGGVVFLYRCASRAACPDVAAKLEALAASLPVDPLCTAGGEGVRNRVVVVPDPDLPEGVQVAAASWGNTLIARCFDEGALRDFYTEHTGQGPEATCAEGFVGDDVGDAGVDGDAMGGLDAGDAGDSGHD